MMPDNIKQYILNNCKIFDGIAVELKTPDTGILTGRLEFDKDGMSKTNDFKFSIIGYIEKILTYSRKDVMIYVNGEYLDKVAPKAITHDAG